MTDPILDHCHCGASTISGTDSPDSLWTALDELQDLIHVLHETRPLPQQVSRYCESPYEHHAQALSRARYVVALARALAGTIAMDPVTLELEKRAAHEECAEE